MSASVSTFSVSTTSVSTLSFEVCGYLSIENHFVFVQLFVFLYELTDVLPHGLDMLTFFTGSFWYADVLH